MKNAGVALTGVGISAGAVYNALQMPFPFGALMVVPFGAGMLVAAIGSLHFALDTWG